MATDFRDGTTFPRPGRLRIGPFMWLARMSDKGRAAAAGTIHDYIYPCPMDRGVLERWNVSVGDFDAAVARYPDDEALSAWLAQRVPAELAEAANAWLSNEKRESLARQDAEEGVAETLSMSATISFTRPDGKSASGWLTEPPHEGAPGIVMLEEWWGTNAEIKAMARRFAEAGFRVLIPDLFDGRVTESREEAGHMLAGLNFTDAATQYARGAALYLKEGGGKAGVVGFCAGGALALLCAMHVSEFDAAAAFYGYPPSDAGDPGLIKIPLIGHWAEHDEFFPIGGVDAIEERLKAGGVAYEFFRYDAKHAFGNPKGLGHYHEEHAESAIERTIAFFKRALR